MLCASTTGCSTTSLLQSLGCLQAFIDSLAARNISWVPIVDPAIMVDIGVGYRPYDLGFDMDVFIKDRVGVPYYGKVGLLCPAADRSAPGLSLFHTEEVAGRQDLRPLKGGSGGEQMCLQYGCERALARNHQGVMLGPADWSEDCPGQVQELASSAWSVSEHTRNVGEGQ